MAKSLTSQELDAFVRRLKLLVVGVVILFALPLIIYTFYLDRRLDALRDSLRYRPPEVGSDNSAAGDLFAAVQGQVVYVPAYSHIYHDNGDPYLLTITLSVRNTSLDREIVVNSVRYFDTNGKEVKSYLAQPLRLPALASTEFLVERDDTAGGSGANFLVEWSAKEQVTEPIIEAVMIDTKGQQGISFARSGRTVRELAPKQDDDRRSESAESESAHDESK